MMQNMAIPVVEFKVRVYKFSKDEFVQRKLQYLLKWNDGMVLKKAKFWVDFFTTSTIFFIGTCQISQV